MGGGSCWVMGQGSWVNEGSWLMGGSWVMGDGSMGDWPWAWRSTAGRRSGPGAFGALPLLAGAFGASEAGAFGALHATSAPAPSAQ